MSASEAGDLRYDSVPLIQQQLAYFRAENLRVDGSAFRKHIDDLIANNVAVEERMSSAENQNIHMVKFHWGHDHDFGSFQVRGEMGTRHIWMLSRFFDHFGVAPTSFQGQAVLDVGSWTGGVSLVLNRLGARVTAIDEIRKYAYALEYLADSFGLESFVTSDASLYELGPEYGETFDVVLCFSVIYHLSDPIVGLRRLFNVLKPGGLLLVESMSIDSDRIICEYEGPQLRRGDFGWNWFVPAPRAIAQWLSDTGFTNIRVGNGVQPFAVTGATDPMGANRCFAIATKDEHHKISVAGLSTAVA